MALAISGFSRVRRSSSRMRSNQFPEWWASRPCSATRSSTFQLRSPASTSRCASSTAACATSKSEVKNAYLPRARRMSASSAPPSVSRPSSAAVGRLEVARHHGAAGEPDAQPPHRVRLGAVERLPVRRRRHRVADRVEQVAAQRQRRRPVARRWRAGAPRRPAPARRGRRRPRPRSRPRAGGTARRRRRRRTGAGGGRCGPPRRRSSIRRLAASRWIRRRRWGGTSSSSASRTRPWRNR